MPSWTLPNGLRVVHHPLAGRLTTCVGVTMRVGSRDERAGEEGAAHLVEHLAFRDTARYSATQITDLRERLGGGFEASTEKEFTVYSAGVPVHGVWRALDLLASQVREPLFHYEDVVREQRIVLQELAEAEEDFEDRSGVLAEELLFGDGLGREIAGSRRSVSGLDAVAIRRFHRRTYSPRRAAVVVAGDVDRQRFAREVERLFGDWSGGRALRPQAPSYPVLPEAKVLRRHSPSTQVVLAFPGVSADEGERELQAQALLCAMLGATEGSRLFSSIRDRAALAYSVESYTSVYTDAACFAVSFGVRRSMVRRALEIALREMRALATAPSREEFERALESTEARMLLDAESPWLIAREAARGALLDRPVPSLEERLAILHALSLADVQALAQRLFASSRTVLAMVGDPRLPAPRRWLRAQLAMQERRS